jgi:hypothetical protein
MNRQLCCLAVLSCFLLAAFAPVAQADLIFGATLRGSNEVPPNASPAFGFITVDLHADMITLDVMETFGGLVAPASAAHIHCCAPAGTNAAVALPFLAFPFGVTSGTFNHTFNLATDLSGITAAAFVAGLQTGNTYANIHDSVFPGGEIRGQLAAVPEPNSFVLLAGCMLALGLLRRVRKQTE